MKLRPVKTRRIYEEVVEQIRMLVSEGHLKPGDRLPSERDLAERLQVSRASVREALSALEMMGLLEIRSGEGTYIKQVNIDSVVAPLAWGVSMDKNSVLELLEVRKILETRAAGLAAERAENEELREIRETLEEMQDNLAAGKLGDGADHIFHHAVARATKNHILVQLMNAISETMFQALKTFRLKLDEVEGWQERLYEEHEGIYQAILAKDQEKAALLMLEHLESVEDEYRNG
ncbi:transcriptional regulator, GntR family [Syntrophobotulus glycolicus DSM 8271]|uniref:Transcriptional regulator, GntR family n=1 Tax=Syntrophobotulus glycolicus (strain DSM 8271 / FlGlyR) TaxID=645991 RepID=F0SYU2_SYNGF|nr:FadR/GntR family transcriptional regulator [Syntrophobotulus glycolicus]ADY55979.1 transcriptional regulator, GntR family [Syntrophobotulus glycolicus DSM 8271]